METSTFQNSFLSAKYDSMFCCILLTKEAESKILYTGNDATVGYLSSFFIPTSNQLPVLREIFIFL